MKQQALTAKERALQIELVRTRAALERQAMLRGVRDLGNALTPGAVLRSAFPRAASKSASDWLFQLFTLTRRYPLLASSASALLSGVGKRRRWWRIGAGLLLSWQVARSMNRKQD
ncbi:hypothetical protein H0A65_08245 [Alcaligenaceae bacterium]|nr:hypothetical protein [Alcaligenaceae bacterium]